MEYNSSTSQEIAVSGVKALNAFKAMQAAIYTITNAPDNLASGSQEDKLGEQNEAYVADTVEANPTTQEGPEGNEQDETQSITLL